MIPRLKTSIHWTAFPTEFAQQLQGVLKESFPTESADGKFVIDSRIYPFEIILRLGYLKNKQITQFNAEASIEYDPNKENAGNIIGLAVDAAASVLQNYFEKPNTEFPHVWEMHKLEKKEVYLQISKVNSDLEAQADALLGDVDDDKLYQD